MKSRKIIIAMLFIVSLVLSIPAHALTVIVPETEDGLKISNVEVHPIAEHFLEKCADTIPDKEQTMSDVVKCFFLVSGIQEYYPGGIERSELEPYIDFIECDESMIVESDDALTLNFSDNLSLAFGFDENSSNLITQATITIVVEDIDLHCDLSYPITIEF